MTMDILWAISHPPSTMPAGHLPGFSVGGTFAVPTPPYADGTWELYQDFIGAVQSWEYALVSGSGDGAVRMWDMRTGQAHRTLLGHTGPVTCLQFDEIHVMSGNLDKSVRVRDRLRLYDSRIIFPSSLTPNQIWDLRTGGVLETVKYEHGVTALQFDSRKVICASGENGVKVSTDGERRFGELNSIDRSTTGRRCNIPRCQRMDTRDRSRSCATWIVICSLAGVTPL
jgi:division protein 1